MSKLTRLKEPAISVGAGAVYQFSPALMELCARKTRYGEDYSLARIVGQGDNQRIWLPRNMAAEFETDMRVDGLPISVTSKFKPRNSEQGRVISETLKLLKLGASFMMEAPTGFGKSSPADTPVIMFDGTVKYVQDVVGGDVLMGPDSTPRTVYGTHKSWSPIYRITPTKGEPFECNDVHVLSLKCTATMGGGQTYEKGALTNIEVKDYIKQSKTFKHMMKLWRAPGIDLPVRKVFYPYLVGLYLADGQLEHAPRLCCGEIKKPALDYVESVTRVETKYFDRGAWYYPLPDFRDTQKLLVKDGQRYIPDRYLRNSRENRLQLLAGLLDGDGHLVKDTVFELACKDEPFKDQVLWLCRSLGFAAYASKTIKGIKDTGFTGEYWRITISGDTDQIPTKIPNKQAKPRAQKKDHLVTGFKVEYVRDDWVYGFGLDKDHLYLLGDFTVTHNTWCAMDIIAKFGKKTIIIVTKEDIRDQWIAAAKTLLGLDVGKGIGLIQGDTCSTVGASIVIAMIQSLSKEARYPAHVFKDFGLAVWDESGSPDTLVTTSLGQIRLQDLVRDQIKCAALSYNVEALRYEWKPITAYHEHPPKNPMMRITHEMGHLDFTSEHLFYTDRGWVPVKELIGTDFIYLDIIYSKDFHNYKPQETYYGSMDIGNSFGGCKYAIIRGWDKGKTALQSLIKAGMGRVGKVFPSFQVREDSTKEIQERWLGGGEHQVYHDSPRMDRALLPRNLLPGGTQNSSAITCNAPLARVVGLVDYGRRWLEQRMSGTAIESVSRARRTSSASIIGWVLGAWHSAESQWSVHSVFQKVKQAAKAGVGYSLHTINEVQTRRGAFWGKGSSVQGVWFRHPYEGWRATQKGVLCQGDLPEGEKVHELPPKVHSSVGGGKAEGYPMGRKVRVLSVVPICTPPLVYDIEVEGNHNFVANGVLVHNCHRVAADNFSNSAYRIPAMARLGISATPDRKDGKEEVLHAHIGPIRVSTEAAPMTPRIIRQTSPWECPMTRKLDPETGQFKMVQIPHSAGKATHVIKLLANNHARNKLIAEFVAAAYKKDRKILVQSDLKDHLELLVPLIAKSGVPPGDIGFYVGGLKSHERDHAKTKRVIMACVSDDTECLTLDGWKTRSNLKTGELVATYNLERRVIEYQPLLGVHSYDYDGDLCHVERKSADILMTWNHRNVVENRQGLQSVVRADELQRSHRIKVFAPVEYPEGESIGVPLAALMGWVIAEGTYHDGGANGVKISQNRGPKADRIRGLLKSLGFTYSERFHNLEKLQMEFRIASKGGAELVRSMSPDKRLNKSLVSLPLVEAQALFDALIDGDGHRRKDNGRLVFIQKDKETMDWFCILAMRLGYKPTVSSCSDGNGNATYRAYLGGPDLIYLGNGDTKVKSRPYKGVVWCPSTPNTTWVARRNGTVFLTGNTYQMTAEATDIPTLDTLVMATPKSDVRQIVGRVIRFLPDKKEPVVFDIVDKSSTVFAGYANVRSKWYASIGASVGGVKRVVKADGSVRVSDPVG